MNWSQYSLQASPTRLAPNCGSLVSGIVAGLREIREGRFAAFNSLPAATLPLPSTLFRLFSSLPTIRFHRVLL